MRHNQFFYSKLTKKFIKIDNELKNIRKQRSNLEEKIKKLNSSEREKAEKKLWLLNRKIAKLSGKLRKFPYNPDCWYLFSWDEIPGKDNSRFIKYLKQNFGVSWVTPKKIEKNDGGRTINISDEEKALSFKLNNEKTKAILTIDDDKADEFIVKTDNGKLNVYYNSYSQRYPVMPTEFGNVIAEYESYSKNQYGMSMMAFWQHLWLILPKEIKDDLDLRGAKADFNVYVSFVLLTFAFVSFVQLIFAIGITTLISFVQQIFAIIGITTLAFQSNSWYKIFSWSVSKALILVVISLLGSYAFYRISISEHKAYGRHIKAVFDIYKSNLAHKFKISEFSEEKELWARRGRYVEDYIKYLFSWDEIPGKDSSRFIKYLRQNFGVSWITPEKIKKSDGGRTIDISDEKKALSLKLNNEKTKAILTIDDRIYEFIVKTDYGKLNIYSEK